MRTGGDATGSRSKKLVVGTRLEQPTFSLAMTVDLAQSGAESGALGAQYAPADHR
jgi:hypothetical protein